MRIEGKIRVDWQKSLEYVTKAWTRDIILPVKTISTGGLMAKITREDALEYHRLKGKPGKIALSCWA